MDEKRGNSVSKDKALRELVAWWSHDNDDGTAFTNTHDVGNCRRCSVLAILGAPAEEVGHDSNPLLKTRWSSNGSEFCVNCKKPYRDHKHIEMMCPESK
jgi:hypothetical protein